MPYLPVPLRPLRRLLAALLAGCVLLTSPGLAHASCRGSTAAPAHPAASKEGSQPVNGAHAGHDMSDTHDADMRVAAAHGGEGHGDRPGPAHCGDEGCTSAPGAAGCPMSMQCATVALPDAVQAPSPTAGESERLPALASGRMLEQASQPDAPPPRA